MSNYQIIAKSRSRDINPYLDQWAEVCPLCHHSIDARFVTGYLRDDNIHLSTNTEVL